MIAVALFSWPLVVAYLFSRFDLVVAVCVAILAGYLLLPEAGGYNFPMLPAYDKTLVPALTAIIATMVTVSRMRIPPAEMTATLLPGWLPRSRLMLLAIALAVFGSFATALTNEARIEIGTRVLRGLTLYDGFSAVQTIIVVLLPFVLGRKLLSHSGAHRVLLIALCVSAAAYSVLALYEIRMSPQLNRMVYDFFPHSWRQHMRGGGFRPLVFLSHALWLSIYLAMGFLATLSLVRGRARNPLVLLLLAVWIVGTIVLAKSFGAALISVILGAAILLGGVRGQLLIAAIVAAIVLVYPMMRGADLVPTGTVLSAISSIDTERANSLRFRIENEDRLLDKANRKPVFGWGMSGRARVFDDDGQDLTVTDGAWAIAIGEWGWMGYLARFGLLCVPIIVLTLRRRAWNVGPETAGIALVLSANLLDLIPNATLTPVTWLLAGALAGRMERGAAAVPAPVAAAAEMQTIRGRPPALDLGAASREALARAQTGQSGNITAQSRMTDDAAAPSASADPPLPKGQYTRQTRLHIRDRTGRRPLTNRRGAPS